MVLFDVSGSCGISIEKSDGVGAEAEAVDTFVSDDILERRRRRMPGRIRVHKG
jgi:hypothetical protein